MRPCSVVSRLGSIVLPLVACLGVLSSLALAQLERKADGARAQRFVGRVVLPDGSPAAGVVVSTSAGGECVTGADGGFVLAVELPRDAVSLEVTAAVDAGSAGSLVASARVVPAALAPSTSVGRLTLTPAPTCVAKWLPTFGPEPGANNGVLALAEFDDGHGPALYAAGVFTAAGGLHANHVARWDGTSWSALGGGTDDGVLALASFDDGHGPALYAAGDFTTAGDVSASRIAKWDGTTWTALGSGIDAAVNALVVFDDGSGPALYAGGAFTSAGGVSASGVAKWNGASWSNLGSGVSNFTLVRALAVYDDGAGPALYAAGDFFNAGGVPATRIAKWKGSSWSALGSGLDNTVESLAVYDDGSGPALYAGGVFMNAGGAPANRIAKWNGSSWSTLGAGVTSSSGLPTVAALCVYDDGSGPALHAGGFFTSAGGVAASFVAKWDGASWSALGAQVSERVFALATYDDGTGPALYAGGVPSSFGDLGAHALAKWDGANWATLGDGKWVDDGVLVLGTHDDGSGPALVAGGRFLEAGGLLVNHIARWNGTSWSALGSGTDDIVDALATFDDGGGPALYAGGHFLTAGGVAAKGIARWDGTSWSDVGGGVSGWVNALAVYDDGSGPALYAGGLFNTAGGVVVYSVARWDGSSWSALGGGVSDFLNPSVNALAVYDDGSGPALFVGGGFTAAGGVAANRIAKWNGASWSTLGSGVSGALNSHVDALVVHDDGGGSALYVGGTFPTAGGIDVDHVARWDGSSWSALDGGLGHGVSALIVHDSGGGPALYAGGAFGRRLARWDGSSWTTLGLDLSDPVRALASWDDGEGPALYVGGEFLTSPARDVHLAKWGCAPRHAVKHKL